METTPQFPSWSMIFAARMLIGRHAVPSTLHGDPVAYIEFTALGWVDSGIDVAAQPAGTGHT